VKEPAAGRIGYAAELRPSLAAGPDDGLSGRLRDNHSTLPLGACRRTHVRTVCSSQPSELTPGGRSAELG
jgi:hypothetical protein